MSRHHHVTRIDQRRRPRVVPRNAAEIQRARPVAPPLRQSGRLPGAGLYSAPERNIALSILSHFYQDFFLGVEVTKFGIGPAHFIGFDGGFSIRPFKKDVHFNNVSKIYEDNSGHIWIGTTGGGLNKFDKEKGKFNEKEHLFKCS